MNQNIYNRIKKCSRYKCENEKINKMDKIENYQNSNSNTSLNYGDYERNDKNLYYYEKKYSKNYKESKILNLRNNNSDYRSSLTSSFFNNNHHTKQPIIYDKLCDTKIKYYANSSIVLPNNENCCAGESHIVTHDKNCDHLFHASSEYMPTNTYYPKIQKITENNNTKLLIHSETFTKINPYLSKLTNITSNSNSQLKTIDTEQNKVNISNNNQKCLSSLNLQYSGVGFISVMKSNKDKEVDTRDLKEFIQIKPQNRLRKTTNNKKQSYQPKSFPIKITSKCKSQPQITNHSNSIIINTGTKDNEMISNCANNSEELTLDRYQRANDIKEMLNTLLNDLEYPTSPLDNSPTSINTSTIGHIPSQSAMSNGIISNSTSMMHNNDSDSQNYTNEVSFILSNNSCTKLSSNNILNDYSISSDDRQNFTCDNYQIKIKTEKSKNYDKSRDKNKINNKSKTLDQNHLLNYDNKKPIHVRAFTVDPFDELIKSHLSSADRRLKAISKKVDCIIKITGPISNNNNYQGHFHPNRSKVTYHLYLVGDYKDKVDKCLKCIQDSFPSMSLHEISVPSSLIL